MTVGLATTEADALLADHITRALYVQLHTGEPGDDGTSNVSAETTRGALTWDTPTGGSVGIVATFPSWATWDAGAETITHISVWTLAAAGVFARSYELTVPKPVTDGDTVTLSSLTASFTPLAADPA